ncbi:MAG: carboxypeptidase regulatory-like domain-containing protein, partial [Gemmatimonadaceae bacterium]
MNREVSRSSRHWTSLTRALLVLALLEMTVTGRGMAQEGAVGTGGVNGTVRDSLGIPVEGAQIGVIGTLMVGESDEGGRFLLAKAAPGNMTIYVRRIGYRPDSIRVTVLAGQTISVAVVVARLAIDLRPVVVLGRRNLTGRMAGF